MTRASHPPLTPLRGILAMTLPEDAAPPPARAQPIVADLGALTRAVRMGDAAAFARFYDLYGFVVYKHLLVLTKGDEAAAREVFQTVALKLARKIEIFDDECPLRAWLQRVAHNAFIDFCRARRREARHVSLENLELAAPADDAARRRLAEALRQALADCSPEDREILHAIYIDGLSVSAAAAQAGQTYKALESRLARLRQKVRQQLLAHLRHE